MVTNIRKLRRARDWTQTELAKRAGVSRVTVARYETCATEPTADGLMKIAKALDTTIDNLIRATEVRDA